MRIALLGLLVVVFIAGCVSPAQKLGCCLRGNMTEGCVLYNVSSTSSEPRDLRANTTSLPCTMELGCNVSLSGKDYMIPVCTEEDLSSCTSPECTAMVCGDFAYKPRVSPGIGSIEELEGDVPPNLEDEATAFQFYKAQCRFLPMDEDLRQIMKSSKSQINVFRLGVGGSFDEFDQYRYYFPVSDKYCNINPPRSDTDRRVDRYINFLQGDGSDYLNPETDITENCVDGTGDPPPVTFAESTAAKTNNIAGTYNPVVPDAQNYKFAHYARPAFNANWQSDNGGYYAYSTTYMDQSKIFKKLDEAYYKRQLNIAHAESIYGLTAADTTRAPFECDPSANECFSGSCNIQVHNRGVNVMVPGIAEDGAEVVTDCNKVQDENGQTKVICPPTTSVSPNGNDPPTFGYARVEINPAHVEQNNSGLGNIAWFPIAFNSMAQDAGIFNTYWGNWSSIFVTHANGANRNITNSLYSMDYVFAERRSSSCTADYGTTNSTTLSLCSVVGESSYRPPAGGIVFFGKLKDDQVVSYRGNTIIGYAISGSEDFDDILFVKNCGINMSATLPSRPVSGVDYGGCWSGCTSVCSGQPDYINKCLDWCNASVASPPEPCSPGSVSPGSVVETEDFVRIDLFGPNDADWSELMTAFTPYFQDKMDAVSKKGVTQCNTYLSANDAIMSSIPWVINYEKGLNDPYFSLGSLFDPEASYGDYYFQEISTRLSSTAAQNYRTRNVYEQTMTSTAGTSACELTQDTGYWWGYYWDEPTFYYNIAHSRYVYLFKYKDQSKSIGSCAVDDAQYLPEIKTFGWCEPCTTSTLAYQSITARDRVYMPAVSAKVEPATSINPMLTCMAQYNSEWVGWLNWEVTDNVTCSFDPVTDISEYKESIGYIGSPRTIPDATIIKERAGAYMKSGILPVFDLTDASNWNLANPDAGNDDFCLFFLNDCNEADSYVQYDFERLFGNMGASVVIVDHVSSVDDATAKLEEIKERSAIIRERCWGCLTAFHVDSPASNTTFEDIITTVIDPQASFTLDMVTFDYQVSDHSAGAAGPDAVVDDIESYARLSLQRERKPTMLVGFNVENNDGTYSSANYDTLFEKVVERQGDLVKAGLIGIIYSPARDASGNSGVGIVNLDGSGLGTKNPKFCALQGAMLKMTTVPPNSLFTKVIALDNVTCEVCSGLDKTQNNCGPADPPVKPLNSLECDNGVECVMPSSVPAGLTSADYKCPESTVVESCTLCNETAGSFTCTKTFFNGSVQDFSGPMSDITSDLYTDVIAGLPKPLKCCLQAGEGNESVRYSFTKKSFSTPLNKPVVFPKTGDPDVDCGFGADTATISTLSSFCNVAAVPVKDYDINCTIN